MLLNKIKYLCRCFVGFMFSLDYFQVIIDEISTQYRNVNNLQSAEMIVKNDPNIT